MRRISQRTKGDKMPDKKVGHSGRERPITPTQKMEAALSDEGTMNMADPTHDKGKSALVDKFRDREEQWRRGQALHAEDVARAAEWSRQQTAEAHEPAESEGQR
jgi:hypothetical protein